MERKSLSKSLRTKTGLCRLWRSCWRRLIKRVAYTVDRKPGSFKKCTARISQNIDSVEVMVLSQESAPGTHKTIRQISQNIWISKTTVHRIVKRDLKLQRFRKRKAQDLTAANLHISFVPNSHWENIQNAQFHSYGFQMLNKFLLH